MPEQEIKDIKTPIDLNTPIEAKIKSLKGLKLGDDLVNPLEKKLLDDIIQEHGTILADYRESMNADFKNLLEDVADLSEGNQRQLREVAEMLGEKLETKDGGLQMDYELFQKILMFQRDNKMKLTGIVDKTLHAALKEKMGTKGEEKKEDPATAPVTAQTPAVEKEATPYTGYTPKEEIKTREETIQSIASNPYINSDHVYPVGIQNTVPIEQPVATPITTTAPEDSERILPPPIPETPTGIASAGLQTAEKVAPTVSAQTASTPEKPAIKALPVEEAREDTEQNSYQYGKKVGMRERKEIVQNAQSVAELLATTTSNDVLNTVGSTKSIIRILDKYIQEHPEKREEMIQALKNQIGNFSRPLQTAEEVGAFQQLVYLGNPAIFQQLAFIDGEYGDKTHGVFMQEAYRVSGGTILSKITDTPSISSLSTFEQEVLKTNLSRNTTHVGANSSPEEIRMAQILLALNGELGDMAIDGKWTPELEKLINNAPPITSTDSFSAEEAREILTKRFQISSSAIGDMDDGSSKEKNRTGLVGLRGCAIAGAINLAAELGNPNDLRITGGTESGHSSSSFGSNVYTHENGYKLDFGVTPGLVELTGLNRMGRKTEITIKGQRVKFYRHGPNDHFDVTFYPKN